MEGTPKWCLLTAISIELVHVERGCRLCVAVWAQTACLFGKGQNDAGIIC